MDTDKVTLQNLDDAVASPAVEVTNSTNLKDTHIQPLDVTLQESNPVNNGTAVVSNKTEGHLNIDNAGINPNSNLEGSKLEIGSVGGNISLERQNCSGVSCVTSKSFLNILAYGESSSSGSSEDSEPDSVDLLQDSKTSDSSDSEWEEIPSNNDVINNVKNYRNRCASSNTSDSNESLEDDMEIGAIGTVKPIPKKSNRTEGDLELDDLPPVPDLSKLSLNVKSEDCIQMGKVLNIIDRLVTIESLPNTPAFDLDTLLFLDQGKVPLGYVYDVIGQVSSPIYVIRFNTKEEIESRGITKGLPVYSAPNSEYTQFVFLKQLLRIKGSDASWQGDAEVPAEFLDYSDDEHEYEHTKLSNINEKTARPRRKKRNSLDKHKLFETAMNIKNEVNSAQYEFKAAMKAPPKKTLKYRYHQPQSCRVQPTFEQAFHNFATQNFAMPPNFNMMNVPPPMFNVHVPPYPMMHYSPNPQFPPPAFGSPAVPPLPPHMPHVPAQPAPPGYHPMLPSMPLAVCKPVPQIPKMQQSSGVVPKTRPLRYTTAAEYHYPNNSSVPRETNPFLNIRQNPPPAFGTQPYSSVGGAYNIPFPNNGGTQFKNP